MVAMKLPPSFSEQMPTLYLFTPLPPTPIPYPFAPGLAASLFAYVGRAIVLPVSE